MPNLANPDASPMGQPKARNRQEEAAKCYRRYGNDPTYCPTCEWYASCVAAAAKQEAA